MNLLNIFKRKEEQDLRKIGKNEKKQFLSNDFIERMIRVEQKVFESLGEKKNYNETKYYQGLTNQEKISFNNFLKTKHNKRNVFFGVFLLGLVLVFAFNTELTGNVINENIGEGSSLIFSVILMSLVMGGIFLFVINSISDRIRENRFQSHFKILENLYLKRGLRKYFRK
jgi:uncharacterized membrane protein (DUF485 family)